MDLRCLIPLLVSLALPGCGKQPDAPDPLKAQRQVIDKAKALDQTMQKAASDLQKKVDDAESK